MTKSKMLVNQAFHEVHAKTPRTVPKGKKGKAKQKMLIAIALSKARAKGARV
jgi:hypothetical protein